MSDIKSFQSDYSVIKPNINPLISEATKKSFLSSSDSNFSSHTTTSVSVNDKTCTTPYVPLLPRRHVDESRSSSSSVLRPSVGSKWNNTSRKPIIIQSNDSTSVVTSSTLLSKVDVDDDIEFSVDDITPAASWDNMPTSQMHLPHSKISDSSSNVSFDTKTYLVTQPPVNDSYHSMRNYAAAGDMTYFAAQSKNLQPPNKSIETKNNNEQNALTSSIASSTSSSLQSTSSVQTSYVVNEPTFSSLDSARAAGYPVITKSSEKTLTENQQASTTSSASTHSGFQDKNSSNFPNKFDKIMTTNSNTIQPKPEESVHFTRWADLGKYYSKNRKQTDVDSMSQSKYSEQFTKLLHDLELVQFNALKFDKINHGDITKAVQLLRKARSPSDNSNPNDIPVADECSTSQSKDQDKSSSNSSNAIVVLNKESSVPISNKTFSKSDSKSDVVLSTHNSVYDTNSSSVKSPFRHKIAFEESEKKNNSCPSNTRKAESTKTLGDASAASPPQEVSYDTFSFNVKTSSRFSTPSKEPTELKSPMNNDFQDHENELKPTGFVILDEKTPPGKLARKKEQFLRGRLKKEEEHRKVQMEREMEAEKRKIEAQQQQEKLLQKKQEEKEKRNKIFKDYQRQKRKEKTAALRNPGVIGSSSPSNLARRSPLSKNMSLSSDRLHMLGRIGSSKNASTPHLTIPASARVINHINHPFGLDEDSDSLGSGGSAEYTGPKLFKQLRSKSNKTLITNAVSHCCLSGKVNEKNRNKTLQALEESEARHLMVLFRDNNCQYRALYNYLPVEERLYKICGNGPNVINPSMIEALYKYNSGRRAFTCVPSKTLSVSIDGITIRSSLWHHALKK